MWTSKCTCKKKWCIIPFNPHPKVLSSSLPNRTRLCEPNLCRLKTLGVIQLLYLPGRVHTQLCLGPSCTGSRHIPQTSQLSQRGYWSVAYSRKALSAALSSDWIHFSKCWMAGYPEQMAIWQECWITHAEKPLHELQRPHAPEALCKCAAGLPQLGVSDSLCRDPWAVQQPALNTMLLDLTVLVGTAELCLGPRGLQHCFYLGLSEAHDSPPLDIPWSLVHKPSFPLLWPF